MHRKLSGITMAVLGAFLAASLLLPTTTAQAPTFSFTTEGVPPGPVTPVEVTTTVSFDWTYSVPLNPVQGAAGVTNTAQVTFDVQCPADRILVSGGLTQTFALDPAQTTDYEGTIQVLLTVLRTAPGLEPASCDVSGSVGQVVPSAIPASNTQTYKFDIKPDYVPYLEAQSASKLRQGGPQKQIPFAIDITNFGNAPTKVIFAIDSAPKGKWQGLLPDPALLDAPGGNLQSKQIVFNVATPYKNGWNNDEGSFTISMTPEYQFNSEKKGSPVTVTVLARVRGVYVPSIEPFVMVAAILGTALVARLQREEE